MTTLYLRPNAAGNEAALSRYPNTGEANWQDVDEASPDEDATYVFSPATEDHRDLYNLDDTSQTGTINWIKVWMRCSGLYAYTVIKVSGYTAREGSQVNPNVWSNWSTQYTTNPDAGGAWTWAQLNALQAGVRLIGAEKGDTRCTQVYIEVDYTAAVAYSKTLTESLGLLDKVVKSPSVVKTEALGLVDAYSRIWNAYRTYSELLGLADTVAKMPSKTLPEILGLADALTKEPGKVLAEPLGLVDIYSRTWAAYRTCSELLGLADSIRKEPAKIFPEALGLLDSVAKSPSVVKTEALGLVDAYSRIWNAYRTYSELLGLADTVAKMPSKTFPEPLGLVDSIVKAITVARTESLGLEDRVSKHVSLHALTEVLGLLDSISYTPNPIVLAKLIRKLIQLEDIGGGVGN
jgi:hypothetical protein